MIIDVHCHFLPTAEVTTIDGFEVLDMSEPTLAYEGRRLGSVIDRLTDVSILLEESEKYGVDRRFLCAPSWLHCSWAEPSLGAKFARAMNDGLGELSESYPKQLGAMATVPLQDVDLAVRELERCANELDFKAVATNTHINGRYFDDRGLWPFLEAAADLGMPVFLHPHDVLGVDRMDRYRLVQMVGNPHDSAFAAVRTVLGGVLDAIPSLKLAFVQVGGSLPSLFGRIEHTWNVRSETSELTEQPPSAYWPRLFYDSIAHSPEPIETMLRHVPVSQILMGSDYPWDMGEEPGSSIRELDRVDQESKAQMLGKNAADLLGWK